MPTLEELFLGILTHTISLSDVSIARENRVHYVMY